MRCSMPRRARIAPGEIIYHTLNRANERTLLFDKPEDYAVFERIMVAAMRRSPIRLLAYCLMPNQIHDPKYNPNSVAVSPPLLYNYRTNEACLSKSKNHE